MKKQLAVGQSASLYPDLALVFFDWDVGNLAAPPTPSITAEAECILTQCRSSSCGCRFVGVCLFPPTVSVLQRAKWISHGVKDTLRYQCAEPTKAKSSMSLFFAVYVGRIPHCYYGDGGLKK